MSDPNILSRIRVNPFDSLESDLTTPAYSVDDPWMCRPRTEVVVVLEER